MFKTFFPLFITLILFGSCNVEPERPISENRLVYLSPENEIIVWDAVTENLDTVANLDSETRIGSLKFNELDIVTYATYSNEQDLAIRKETGDTSKCPCVEGAEDENGADQYVIKGIVGDARFTQIKYYFETVFAISINEKSTWIHQKIKHEIHNKQDVYMHIDNYDADGNYVSSNDSTYSCERQIWGYRNYECHNDFSERFHSESETINGICYVTRGGNIYKRENEEEALFLEFDGRFDEKFGNGYYHPTLNYDGSKIIVTYAEHGLWNTWSETSPADLYSIDTQTKKATLLSEANYQNPQFSPDGRYVVLNLMNNTYADEKVVIYIYDVQAKSFIKLGAGSRPIWYKNNHRYA
jgi:hypothetical protein